MYLSTWEKETFFATQDVIIVGSGLLGLWSALELKTKHPKLKITVLERGIIPTGASTRNAGFACFGSPSELLHDKEMHGSSNMWLIVETRFKGIEKIKKVFAEKVLDYKQSGGYEVYSKDSANLDEVNDKIGWLNKGLKTFTGKKNCFEWANSKIKEFGFAGFNAMVENKLEGTLHSGKLVKALLQKVQGLGVQIFTNIEVEKWERIKGKVIVNPHQSLSFSTRQLLICTNAFTNQLLPDIDVKPARGQIMVTWPIDGLTMKGAFHYDEGFYYFRNIGNRVLLGGARNSAFDEEETTAMDTSDMILSELERFLACNVVPGRIYVVEDKWSGIMGFTKDKQPIVERIDDKVVVAVSCNGMGVAMAPIVAEKVCEMML